MCTNQVLVDDGIIYTSFAPATYTLTIDYKQKRIYFINNLQQTLESIDYEGRDRGIAYQSPLLAFSYTLDIYENYIYWANGAHNAVFKISKYGALNGNNSNVAIQADNRIDRIKIIHPSKQPRTENRCQHARCSYLCLPVDIRQHRCVCQPQQTTNRISKTTNKCQQSVSFIIK